MTRSQKHFGELKRIHLIGIGGSGMIGLAMVLQKKGFIISGSDLQMTEELSSLKALGAKVQLGHDPALFLQRFPARQPGPGADPGLLRLRHHLGRRDQKGKTWRHLPTPQPPLPRRRRLPVTNRAARGRREILS